MTTLLDPKLSSIIVTTQSDEFEFSERTQVLLENTLNLLSYTPFTSRFGGLARLFIGTAQLIQSIILIIFGSIADFFVQSPKGYGYRSRKHMIYAIHSVSNIVRSLIELSSNSSVNSPRFNFFIPGLYVSLFFIIYDQLLNVRVRYPIEYTSGYTDPYLRAWEWIRPSQSIEVTIPSLTGDSSRLTKQVYVSSFAKH